MILQRNCHIVPLTRYHFHHLSLPSSNPTTTTTAIYHSTGLGVDLLVDLLDVQISDPHLLLQTRYLPFDEPQSVLESVLVVVAIEGAVVVSVVHDALERLIDLHSSVDLIRDHLLALRLHESSFL